MPITTLYAALLALLQVVLAGFVVRARRAHKVNLGAGPRGEIEQPVRVHANLAENAPIFLLLLLLAELAPSPAGLLHGAGVVFCAARLLHAVGLSERPGRSFGRFWGTLLTWLTIVALALYLLVRVVAGAVGA